MNLLFVHSHKFRKIDGKIYTSGSFPVDVLIRYVEWYGNVTIAARIIEEKSIKRNYSVVNHPKIKIEDSSNLKRLVKTSDAIVVRLPSPNGYKAVYWARKYKKPYLVEVVACIWDAYWNYNMVGKLMALPAMKIMQKCVLSASHVLYVSQNFLQSRYPTRGIAVSVSDVELLEKDLSILEHRLNKIACKDMHKLVLGTVAAIDVPHKGQEYLIKAIKKIEDKLGIEVEYQMVGGGDKDRLYDIAKVNGVKDKIEFLGFMNHEEVFSWMDNIDIYVQPSFQEGLCRALVEASSRGLPCIASCAGGNPEIIDNAYIFSTKNKKAIPDLICDLVVMLFKKQNMEVEATKNFNRAVSVYERDMLKQRRNAFYGAFKNFVEEHV